MIGTANPPAAISIEESSVVPDRGQPTTKDRAWWNRERSWAPGYATRVREALAPFYGPLIHGTAVSAVYVAVCLAAAYRVLSRRDIGA